VAKHFVIGRSTSGFPRAPSTIIGREREQVVLREELAAALDGRGRFVLLAGETGIGKTSLARDLAGEAATRGAAVASARCPEIGGAPAFAPWRELLAALPDAATREERLPPPFGAGDPAQSAYQLRQEIAAHLRATAADQPVLLLVDDLHWADRDSLDLLDDVTRSLSQAPILLVAAYRPESLRRELPLHDALLELHRDRPVTTLRLANLDVAATAALVAAGYGPCSPELAEYLHARSDGHPLYLVELLRDLSERELLPRDDAGRLLPPTRAIEMPALPQHLVAHRIARPGAEEETLLSVAAVVGEEWDLGIVEAILDWDEDPLLRALEAALRADVILPAGTGERYRFRHGMIREVLYGGQLARRRKRLHARVAAILETSPERPPKSTARSRTTSRLPRSGSRPSATDWPPATRRTSGSPGMEPCSPTRGRWPHWRRCRSPRSASSRLACTSGWGGRNSWWVTWRRRTRHSRGCWRQRRRRVIAPEKGARWFGAAT
jgi:predicted ATPase